MIPVKFDKSCAIQYLDDLYDSRPLSPPEGKDWTRNELILLAGVLKFALHIFRPAGYEYTFQDLPKETQEAFAKGKRSTITAAIELTSQLTGRIHFDEYDEVYDDIVIAEVREAPGRERACIVDFKRGRKVV